VIGTRFPCFSSYIYSIADFEGKVKSNLKLKMKSEKLQCKMKNLLNAKMVSGSAILNF